MTQVTESKFKVPIKSYDYPKFFNYMNLFFTKEKQPIERLVWQRKQNSSKRPLLTYSFDIYYL